jgi:hypothetical protein
MTDTENLTDEERLAEWVDAEATIQLWRDAGLTVDEFKEANLARQYQEEFPQISPAETALWERALGTGQVPPLVELRLRGFTWHQAIGCLPGLWLSRPEDTDTIDRLGRELREKAQAIEAGLAENKHLRAQLKNPENLDQETFNQFAEYFRVRLLARGWEPPQERRRRRG